MQKHTRVVRNIKVPVTRGSGNVFADLRLPNAAAELAKAKLVIALATEIRTQGLKQADAAQKLGLTQPKISKLLHGDTSGFSTDKILSLLTQLGKDVKIEVKRAPARATTGHVEVYAPTYAAAKKR
jgi:predicted XRE-type DNA-binding protein